jgi:hypothetical protein
MATKEKLYSDIPPTKLRNKEEKFKPAKTSPFWIAVANFFFFNMLILKGVLIFVSHLILNTL